MYSDLHKIEEMLLGCEDMRSFAYTVKLFGDFRESGIDVAESCALVLEDMYGTE